VQAVVFCAKAKRNVAAAVTADVFLCESAVLT